MKPLVSIIIVKYRSKKYLSSCLASIKKNPNWEVIVIDNDKKNIGYGAACNKGAKKAKGEFLFFLNPDTLILPSAIKELAGFLKTHPKAGIVAPLLLNRKKRAYSLQGSAELTPKSALFSLSFLHKLWPNNPITQKYWLMDWNKKEVKEVAAVPGSALMIRRKIFEKINGFDENFFLFFEEIDLCKRVREAGWKIFFQPKAKVIHFWQGSTPQNKKIKKIFQKSRFYFFKKHYGIFTAIFLEFFFDYLPIFFLLILGSFLRFYRIKENLVFHGELGDNYLAIKDAVFNKHLPLLGPPTSHSWLYFGPLFYYLLIPFFLLTSFHPATGAYLIAFFSSLTILINYLIIKEIFDKKTALFSSFLITISPLWLNFTRGARFFCLVPFLVYFVIWTLFKAVQTQGRGLFWLGLSLGVILNFHYSALIFLPVILTIFYYKKINPTKKEIFKCLLGFLIPNLPLLIADSFHGFSMISKFFLWIPYRILGFINLYPKNNFSLSVMKKNIEIFSQFLYSSFLPK